MRQWRPWREAIEQALYGPGGFFRGTAGPAAHFRTSVHVSGLFARALLRLAGEVDEALSRPARFDVVDVGAGRGELLRAMAQLAPPSLSGRLCLHGVELAGRPPDLPSAIGWSPAAPDGVTGLLVANEWLDDVPVEVVEQAAGGPRVVLVDPATGQERYGDPPTSEDLAWLDAWWPVNGCPPGDRAEVGRLRDAAWASAVGALDAGIGLAIDYGHVRAERAAGAYAAGTLAGYRRGRAVPPVPDGSCDVTSHVAVDACAAAGERAGATATTLTTQRDALRALGVSGARPPHALASASSSEYVRALRRAGEAAELTAQGGLGDFWWLVQGVGVEIPPSLPTMRGL